MEMLLVLAILVAVSAMAAPAMHDMWQRRKLPLAADQLRAALSRTRTEAMRSGKTQVFRCELGGSKYFSLAWSAGDELINGSAQEAVDSQQLRQDASGPKLRELPEGVTFGMSEASLDTRSIDIEETLRQSDAGGMWSPPIVFYPDGTSSQSKIEIVGEKTASLTIALRGLTGLASVEETSGTAELAQEGAS
jgi:type II secretory pathway pseudopilin PulG